MFRETLFKKISSDLKIDEKYIKNLPINEIRKKNMIVQESFLIKEIPSSGIILNKPGKYTFKNNIDWRPETERENDTAIRISSNDIILDFQGYTLNCLKTSIKTIGIEGENIKNIKIYNGKISNFLYKGVNIQKYSSLKIKNITIDGLSWQEIGDPNNNTPVGIFLNQGSKAKIEKVTVKNINVRTDSSAAFQVVESFEIAFSHCKVSNYKNQDGSVQGFSTLFVENSTFYKCSASNLQSFFNGNILTSGHTVLGFVPIFCYNLNYYKCSVKNIFGSCDDVHGMSIFLNSNIVVKKFVAKNIIDGLTTNTGAKATGLEVYGSNIKIYDSVVKDIKAINPQDKQATGFSCAMGTNIDFIRCIAENVTVTDEKGNRNPSFGFGEGFGWAPDPRPLFTFPVESVRYLDCKAKNCQVGFDSWYHINSLWENIETCNCDISIFNAVNSQRTYNCNACSECIIPLETVLTNVAKNNKFKNVKSIYY